MSNIPGAPVHFREIFKPKVWGGRRMEQVLGKRLPPNKPIGESWEVSDHPNGVSSVDEGELAGTTLRALVEADEAGLVGRRGVLEVGGRFPLLFKFIDATEYLSVQVHPDDAYAAGHEKGDPGKSEAWYILYAEPGARIGIGLTGRMTREEFAEAVESGAADELLRFIDVKRGDVIDIPAGTLHALGPGIVLAEIQQNSDATYRVFDWGRAGLDGKPRDLHIEKALDVIDFGMIDAAPAKPRVLSERGPRHERLIANVKFTFDRYLSDAPFEVTPAELKSFVMIACIGGRAELSFPGGRGAIELGQTLLLPATLSRLKIEPRPSVELLAMSRPV